jgi:hypothetical protein
MSECSAKKKEEETKSKDLLLPLKLLLALLDNKDLSPKREQIIENEKTFDTFLLKSIDFKKEKL